MTHIDFWLSVYTSAIHIYTIMIYIILNKNECLYDVSYAFPNLSSDCDETFVTEFGHHIILIILLRTKSDIWYMAITNSLLYFPIAMKL